MGAIQDRRKSWIDQNMALSMEELQANLERYNVEIARTDPQNYRYGNLTYERDVIIESMQHKAAGESYNYATNQWIPAGGYLNQDMMVVVPSQEEAVSATITEATPVAALESDAAIPTQSQASESKYMLDTVMTNNYVITSQPQQDSPLLLLLGAAGILLLIIL
jgi:hypothetical protein